MHACRHIWHAGENVRLIFFSFFLIWWAIKVCLTSMKHMAKYKARKLLFLCDYYNCDPIFKVTLRFTRCCPHWPLQISWAMGFTSVCFFFFEFFGLGRLFFFWLQHAHSVWNKTQAQVSSHFHFPVFGEFRKAFSWWFGTWHSEFLVTWHF